MWMSSDPKTHTLGCLPFQDLSISMTAMRSREQTLSCWPSLKRTTFGLLVALLTGCVSNKGFWQKHTNSGTLTVSGKYPNQGFNPPLVLTAEEISAAMVGTETNGSILVSYGEDLQPQATLVARVLEQTITEAEQAMAAPLPVRPHLFLLRMAHERRVV